MYLKNFFFTKKNPENIKKTVIVVAKEDQAQTKLGVHKAVVVEMEAGVVTEDLAVVLTTVWAAADNRVAVVVCLKWVETAEEASIRTKKKDN